MRSGTELSQFLILFDFNGPLRQYFSLSRVVSQRGIEEEKR